MSLAMTAFVSGILGVFIVMTFLQIMVNLSSKLAIRLEKRESPDKN
ncbi:MAG: oxaloacetate decarboxylase subunit gamma [Syntrophomonadales bacterium]|jgi:Na+-transporting methylmalonyl-CoA/oxaloacetate decarboxylase gamma subunit